MHSLPNLFRVIGRGAALTTLFTAIPLVLNAQQIDSGHAKQSVFAIPSVSTTALIAANELPDPIGYSSSAGASEMAAAVNFIGLTGVSPSMQPPPRRYGRRPVYADSAHNSDGSNKYTFFGGAGFTVPTGGTHAYYSPSYNFQVGAGRNFNKELALLVQFDWANFALQNRVKDDLAAIYLPLGISGVGGHGHIWSFTLDPQFTFIQGDKAGAYVIGGIGFYHKVTDLTTPTEVLYFDPYYGPLQLPADETFDSYVSNAFGVNGGIGFTYRPSRFGNEKFYAEARYVYTDNQPRPFFIDAANTTNPTSNPNYFNAFPQNSATSTYIPVTFGIRF